MTGTVEKLPDLAVMYRCHVVAGILQGFSDGVGGDALTAAMDWALTGKGPDHGDGFALLGVFAAPWQAAKEEGHWDGCPSAMAEADLAKAEARAAQIAALDGGPHHAAMTDVANERLRQVAEEGWTPEHDGEHDDGSLAFAAAAYAIHAANPGAQIDIRVGRGREFFNGGWANLARLVWPASWDRDFWKPKDPRRDLVRAGALILAEIERLDRVASADRHSGGGRN